MKFSQDNPVKIVMLGAGGTGGYIAPFLYRMASIADREIKTIICDGDKVELKNLVRQNFVYQDVGSNKAQVIANRYSQAFGLPAFYIPSYIEDENTLLSLLAPEENGQMIILIGAVDNNKSRRLCDTVFKKLSDIIYIDSGNGEYYGQVVCGIKKNNITVQKPMASYYPEVLSDVDLFPSELSCADANEAAPQTVAANMFAANIVSVMLFNILFCGVMNCKKNDFSTKTINSVSMTNVKKSYRRAA